MRVNSIEMLRTTSVGTRVLTAGGSVIVVETMEQIAAHLSSKGNKE